LQVAYTATILTLVCLTYILCDFVSMPTLAVLVVLLAVLMLPTKKRQAAERCDSEQTC
jgi:hypothetical protein